MGMIIWFTMNFGQKYPGAVTTELSEIEFCFTYAPSVLMETQQEKTRDDTRVEGVMIGSCDAV